MPSPTDTSARVSRPLPLVLLHLLPTPAAALPAAPTLGPASHGTGASAERIQVQEQEVDARDRVARAVRREGELRIDGRLDEEAWRRAEVVTGFTQREPDEGEPAMERTEVRILYDDDNVYLGARMYDSDPSQIARQLTRRD